MDSDTPLTGPRLLEMRKRRGWSQERLARELRVSTASVRHWEAGRRAIRPMVGDALRRLLTH